MGRARAEASLFRAHHPQGPRATCPQSSRRLPENSRSYSVARLPQRARPRRRAIRRNPSPQPTVPSRSHGPPGQAQRPRPRAIRRNPSPQPAVPSRSHGPPGQAQRPRPRAIRRNPSPKPAVPSRSHGPPGQAQRPRRSVKHRRAALPETVTPGLRRTHRAGMAPHPGRRGEGAPGASAHPWARPSNGPRPSPPGSVEGGARATSTERLSTGRSLRPPSVSGRAQGCSENSLSRPRWITRWSTWATARRRRSRTRWSR